MHSWLADHLALVASDLASTQVELVWALAIAPDNASNRLKVAHLEFLQGLRDNARATLGGLDKGRPIPLEHATFSQLAVCLEEEMVLI